MLESYAFGYVDEFDDALLSGVQKGYFDDQEVRRTAESQHKNFQKQSAQMAEIVAWNMYHGSFDANEAQVVDAIYTAYLEGIQYVSVVNLDGMVRLFKDLGYHNLASLAIRTFVDARADEKELFDLSRSAFPDHISDPELISTFREKAIEETDERNPAEVLLKISSSHSWDNKDTKLLASMSVEGYIRMFRATTGEALPEIVKSSLMFGKAGNASEVDLEISRRATEALQIIGAESILNRRRIERYGVQVDGMVNAEEE